MECRCNSRVPTRITPFKLGSRCVHSGCPRVADSEPLQRCPRCLCQGRLCGRRTFGNEAAHGTLHHFRAAGRKQSEYSARYDNSRLDEDDAQDESCWVLATTSSQTIARITSRTGTNTSFVPTRLTERCYKFTKLQSNDFFYCVSLGTLKLIGVIWLRQSLEPPDEILPISEGTLFATVTLKEGHDADWLFAL
jgi:hypothetical protein